MACNRLWAITTLSRYITCSRGASKPVSSMLLTITMPRLPSTPSSLPPKGSLKRLMLLLCLGSVEFGLYRSEVEGNVVHLGVLLGAENRSVSILDVEGHAARRIPALQVPLDVLDSEGGD